MKHLILYTFYKVNENIHYFLKYGVFKSPDYTFLFITNDKHCNLQVPNFVQLIKRENIGFDFGAWSEGLLHNDYYKQFDKFLFINGSVKGPFVPTYFSGNWCDIFFNGLKDNVRLFGSTINSFNCHNPIKKHRTKPRFSSHVQSMVFCCEKPTLEFLIENKIFTLDNFTKTKLKTVEQREFPMSRLIIEKGWNIGCLIKHYQNIDFTYKKPAQIKFLGDFLYKDCYNGHSIHPYEIVFIKTNRGIPINSLL